jgi:hypothetical protein
VPFNTVHFTDPAPVVEPVTFISTVKHLVKAGEPLTKGQAVYVTGSTGQSGTNMIVGKASNVSEATSSKTMGLIETDLATNGIGYVITEGLLAGLDTSAAGNAGDPVWLGTNGNLIYGLPNKPVAPAHLVFIGIVTRKQQNNGEIFVKAQNGFELREIHDVLLDSNGSIADNEVLAYDTASGLWKNQTAAEASLATQSYVDTSISNLINSAPATLNTLNELAAALNNDSSFATTVTNSLALKAPIASPTFTGTVTLPGDPSLNLHAATKKYVDDTSLAAALSYGKLKQVVQGTTSTAYANSTTTMTDTGLSATITPTSATSKILVLVSHNSVFKTSANANNGANVNLLRDSTVISGSYLNSYSAGTGIFNLYSSVQIMYLDSPNTTSATIYKTQMNNVFNGPQIGFGPYTQSIILIEIGA